MGSYLKVILISMGLLLIPFIAMQFTDEVNWEIGDFFIMGIMLSATGISIQFVFNKIDSQPKRIILISIIIVFFLLIWAELAVGIF